MVCLFAYFGNERVHASEGPEDMCEFPYHVCLPGFLYVMCCDDDRDFSCFHDLYEVLPDPSRKTHDTNMLGNSSLCSLMEFS